MNYSIFEQGDVVVARLLFSEQVGSKRRPALVISSSMYNQESSDIILLKITSTNRPHPFDVQLNAMDLADGKLKKVSQIMVDNPQTAYKGIIENKIARINPAKLLEIKEKMKELYEIQSQGGEKDGSING